MIVGERSWAKLAMKASIIVDVYREKGKENETDSLSPSQRLQAPNVTRRRFFKPLMLERSIVLPMHRGQSGDPPRGPAQPRFVAVLLPYSPYLRILLYYRFLTSASLLYCFFQGFSPLLFSFCPFSHHFVLSSCPFFQHYSFSFLHSFKLFL